MNLIRLTTASILLACVCACSQTDAEVPETDESEAPPSVSQVSVLDSSWQVEDLDEGGIVDNSMITIEFPEEGRVAGRGGCNPYFGGVAVEGDAINFTGMGSGMMACAEALMQQESRFFMAMSEVVAYTISENGILVLTDADDQPRIRAIALESEEKEKPVPLDMALETTTEFDCGDAGIASKRFLGPDTVEIILDGTTHIMVLERSASGAKYVSSEGDTFWNKGDEAMIEISGTRLKCTLK